MSLALRETEGMQTSTLASSTKVCWSMLKGSSAIFMLCVQRPVSQETGPGREAVGSSA